MRSVSLTRKAFTRSSAGALRSGALGAATRLGRRRKRSEPGSDRPVGDDVRPEWDSSSRLRSWRCRRSGATMIRWGSGRRAAGLVRGESDLLAAAGAADVNFPVLLFFHPFRAVMPFEIKPQHIQAALGGAVLDLLPGPAETSLLDARAGGVGQRHVNESDGLAAVPPSGPAMPVTLRATIGAGSRAHAAGHRLGGCGAHGAFALNHLGRNAQPADLRFVAVGHRRFQQ